MNQRVDKLMTHVRPIHLQENKLYEQIINIWLKFTINYKL